MQLHCAKGTISIAVAIALEEAGAVWEPVRLDFSGAEQTSEAYLTLNPKGRVPTLVADDQVLTETGALLEFAAPALVPVDPLQAARMREVMYYLASTMHVAHAHKMRGHRWADRAESHADMKAKVPETMTVCCAYLEGALPFTPFATGADMTCADPYLFMVVGWAAGDGVDMAAFPKLSGFLEMMDARPSVQAVRAMGLL